MKTDLDLFKKKTKTKTTNQPNLKLTCYIKNVIQT